MTELRGRHVGAMFVAGFGIIIAVNILLAVKAVGTFPGLEVANSYVASQSFDARRKAQQALGWTARAQYRGGVLQLRVLDRDGTPAPIRDLTAHVGRPTEARDDVALALDAKGRAAVDLARGLWRLDVTGRADDGTAYQRAISLRVDPSW
ncbi:MAG: FixH family protein [Paracoccus sp. (in: a-proteobacteria)]|uniref:FixH family protein n=1 Tax=Paracoccus sp. TaxID=267 RepID=UPI0032423504